MNYLIELQTITGVSNTDNIDEAFCNIKEILRLQDISLDKIQSISIDKHKSLSGNIKCNFGITINN